MKNRILAYGAVLAALLMVLIVLATFQVASAQNVSIGDFPDEQTGRPQLLELYEGDVITSVTVYGAILDVTQYDAAELQWTLDAADSNTTTLGYQYSNNGVDWVTVQLTSTVGDVSGWSAATVTGAQLRFYVSAPAAANTVTDTVTVWSAAVFEPVAQ